MIELSIYRLMASDPTELATAVGVTSMQFGDQMTRERVDGSLIHAVEVGLRLTITNAVPGEALTFSIPAYLDALVKQLEITSASVGIREFFHRLRHAYATVSPGEDAVAVMETTAIDFAQLTLHRGGCTLDTTLHQLPLPTPVSIERSWIFDVHADDWKLPFSYRHNTRTGIGEVILSEQVFRELRTFLPPSLNEHWSQTDQPPHEGVLINGTIELSTVFWKTLAQPNAAASPHR